MKIESLPIFFNKLNQPCKILENKKIYFNKQIHFEYFSLFSFRWTYDETKYINGNDKQEKRNKGQTCKDSDSSDEN